jgi:hypothetical protein
VRRGIEILGSTPSFILSFGVADSLWGGKTCRRRSPFCWRHGWYRMPPLLDPPAPKAPVKFFGDRP